MSDAQDEWEEWRPYGSVSNPMYEPHIEAAFIAGYAKGQVNALEDAAKELRAKSSIGTEDRPQRFAAIWDSANWLSERAEELQEQAMEELEDRLDRNSIEMRAEARKRGLFR